LIGLTACSARTAVKTAYIPASVPELPPEPAYYEVLWRASATPGWYCLDEAGAKNLLKNHAIMQGYQAELRQILETLSGDKNGRN